MGVKHASHPRKNAIAQNNAKNHHETEPQPQKSSLFIFLRPYWPQAPWDPDTEDPKPHRPQRWYSVAADVDVIPIVKPMDSIKFSQEVSLY